MITDLKVRWQSSSTLGYKNKKLYICLCEVEEHQICSLLFKTELKKKTSQCRSFYFLRYWTFHGVKAQRFHSNGINMNKASRQPIMADRPLSLINQMWFILKQPLTRWIMCDDNIQVFLWHKRLCLTYQRKTGSCFICLLQPVLLAPAHIWFSPRDILQFFFHKSAETGSVWLTNQPLRQQQHQTCIHADTGPYGFPHLAKERDKGVQLPAARCALLGFIYMWSTLFLPSLTSPRRLYEQ